MKERRHRSQLHISSEFHWDLSSAWLCNTPWGMSSFGSVNLLKKDLIVSIVSMGLEDLPSKMTLFLCVHIHQRVVKINSKALALLSASWGSWAKFWIHCSTGMLFAMMETVLISTPNHTARAKEHWRNRWSKDSLLALHRLQVGSQLMPLVFNSILIGMAWWIIF